MRFGRYELQTRLGAGGMGEVWRARDHDLHRDVAVKFLPERYAADSGRLGRFAQEARAASQLNHPNIVTIHEIGEAAGMPYIVMELVEGRTLREALADGPVPLKRLLEIGTQIADGLAKAHAAGIVHRDLKPENVMVREDGFVKVLDFGLAKLRSDSSPDRQLWFDTGAPTWPESPSPQTAAGAVLGTVGYMSPEQARGRDVDYRTDQFTLGAILYELATGRPAFRRETSAQTLAAILGDTPEPIAALNPAVPAPVRWVIEGRCLAKDAAERYAATQDLARELRDLREHSTGSAERLSGSGVSLAAGAGRMLARRAGIAALVVAGLWGARAFWQSAWERGDPSRPLVVAVLPLTNVTGDGGQDAAAIGIVQVIVDALSQVDGLEVLPRSSTSPYAARKSDLPGIARALDAHFLVDGVLQRSGERLRVSLSLVRASSKTVEWSETFDGAFPQVFELQSRVAESLARVARLRLSPETRTRLEARATASPSAWEDYVTALALLDRPDRPGNLAAAVTRLEAALRVDPRFALGHAALARACLTRYRETSETPWADRARDAAQEALRLEPRDVDVRRSLAMILHSRGKLAEAIDELKQALVLKPGSDATRRLYSEVLGDAGQPAAALEQARKAVDLRPGDAENHRALGWVHFAAGRFEEAATSYRRATDLQPDNAWAFQMLGTSLHLAGDREAAVAPYKEAIRLAPEARAWANLGYVYYATGRQKEAVEAYAQAVRLEPASGTLRRSLGDARAKAGDLAAARADWRAAIGLSREALGINPKDPRAIRNVAICQAKLGQKEAALATAREALAAAPSSADAHYGAAAVHALTGDAAGSVALLEKALALGSSVSLVKDDDDFASLHERPDFQQLLQRAATSAAREEKSAS
jgi:serine/threonine-protein kinase